MRTSIRLGLTFVCLALAGCSLFNRKQNAQGGSRPFQGSGPSSTTSTGGSGSGTSPSEPVASDSSTPLPGANGLLAGQVLDRLNRRPPKVFVQVVDLQETKTNPTARVEVEATADGFFVVQGLQLGKHYRLIARAKDGEKVLSGTTLAMPPNPRLSIYLSEEFTSPDTPPVPGKSSPGRSNDSGASLESPVRTRPGEVPPESAPPKSPAGGAFNGPGPTVPPNPAQIADQGNKDGFQRWPPPPRVVVPGNPAAQQPYALPPAPKPSTTPPAVPRDDSPLSAPAVPQTEGPAVRLPSVDVPVPSCVAAGGKVENFALYDINGSKWEFRRHRVGKLVLLDFWFSSCAACRQSMSHVVDLQRRYNQFGLEVVGIAAEQGTWQEQVTKVRGVRSRYGIDYTTLLSGGPYCPVISQLHVVRYPTLILLDERGQILWNSKGDALDEDTLRDLETEVRRRLDVR